MTFLLDTDTCVFWLRGRASVHDRMAALAPEARNVSVITVAELRYGAQCSSRPEANHQAIDDFLSGVTVVGVDSDIARAFGKIKAQLRSQGNLIEDFDLLLAATALVYGFTLVTNNVAHFERIEGLILDNWA